MTKRTATTILVLLVVGWSWILIPAWEMGPAASPPMAGTIQTAPSIGTENDTLVPSPFDGIRLARGLQISRFAAHPMLKNPVGLSVDNGGTVYVTETNRRKSSNLDIRDHRDWMVEDLSLTTILEKEAFYKRILAPDRSTSNTWLPDRNEDGRHDWRDLTVESEKINRLTDTDGDDAADTTTTFATGFNTVVTGVAAGVYATGESVYFTVAPDLWKLQDTDGDGQANRRESMVSGFGVHMSYAGHDMSGPTRGPGGRIYWSIGDIGLNVTDTHGKTWSYPNQGAVMRMEPDGSDFEVFAHGLRNPQEIAFDKHGNLFSIDNDGDYPGEHERIVYIVEGSDTGWRTNWQFGKYEHERNTSYNVWLAEKLHKPHVDGQPAYITPAVALYEDGPSGFVYNPGTALHPRWKNHFFSTHFTGSAAHSVITAFRVQPDGATFTLNRRVNIARGILSTSIDFGPGGALYATDWVQGWDTGPKGRVWKMETTGKAGHSLRRETAALLRNGMTHRANRELYELLHHADMRVRKQAQFELVRREAAGRQLLIEATRPPGPLVARLHGIWGIGQFGRDSSAAVKPLIPLLTDPKPEVRAQTAKVIGEAEYGPAVGNLLPLLDDSAPRVRFFAAIALGKLDAERALQPLVGLLEENNNQDPYIRHAGALGLSKIGNIDSLIGLADHPSAAVRVAAVVALRRLQHEGVAAFLDDPDPAVLTEAARAIHDDFSIRGALPDLASLLTTPQKSSGEALLRRVINANFRLGTPEHAEHLARYASRPSAPSEMRAEALACLGVWPDPPQLDRVTGRYRSLEQRNRTVAVQAMQPVLHPILQQAPDTVRLTAIQVAGRLHYQAAGDSLVHLALDPIHPVNLRAAALEALSEMAHDQLAPTVRQSLKADDTKLRTTAMGLIPKTDASPSERADLLGVMLENGSLREQQEALAGLREIPSERSMQILNQWMDRLINGTAPRGLALDIIQAADTYDHPTLSAKLRRYRQAKPQNDPLAPYLETLYGGNRSNGRTIVYNHSSAQCLRCHSIGGDGGNIGPPLDSIGVRMNRRQLLEALVRPSARLAPGYGTTTLTLKDGSRLHGTIRRETAQYLILKSTGEETRKIPESRVQNRTSSRSGMPSMANLLTKSEIRDVVQYLAALD